MSMLQLLGGVAVAGAVAAGTTAFTAGGLTTNLTNANARDNGWLGGSQSVTVLGATLNKLDFTADSTNTGVALATLTFATANLPTTTTVTLVPDTTLHVAGGGSADAFHCSSINTGTGIATCAVSAGSTTTAETGSYYPNPTTVTITVS